MDSVDKEDGWWLSRDHCKHVGCTTETPHRHTFSGVVIHPDYVPTKLQTRVAVYLAIKPDGKVTGFRNDGTDDPMYLGHGERAIGISFVLPDDFFSEYIEVSIIKDGDGND